MPETSPQDREYATRQAARNATHKLALRSGAKVITRPLSAGAATRDVEPVAGMRAARDLEQAAHHLTLNYIRQAREAGCTWYDIGTELNLTTSYRGTGSTAKGAFSYAVGDRGTNHAGSYDPSVIWTCFACDSTISDVATDLSPAGNERGHTDDCPRLQADIDTWDAEWDLMHQTEPEAGA
jgi:hypothetical protein